MIEDPLRYVDVDPNGSILIGNSIVCDGYVEGRTNAVFTHIHSDHVQYFCKTLGLCDKVITSKPTYYLLKALFGDTYALHQNWEGIDFNESFFTDHGEKITLYQANHILGSSQILVETNDDVKILYSGDFNFPGITVPQCDILVLDSTHGNPRFDSVTDKKSVLNNVWSLVYEEIRKSKPVVIKAHRGTMQFIMSLLEQERDGNRINNYVKFLCSETNKRIAESCSIFNMPIRPLIHFKQNPEAHRILHGSKPYIQFVTPGTDTWEQEEKGIRILKIDSNINFENTAAIMDDSAKNRFIINLSSHTSFSNILKYVRATNAKYVITDNSFRTKQGDTLASIIHNELGIKTIARPEKIRIDT